MERRLSEQAKLLALLIDQHTERADDGTILRYWLPVSRRGIVLLRATNEHVVIGGSGYIKMLQALETRGFIEQTPRMRARNPYSYYSTERVAQLAEQEWEWIDRRKAKNDAEVVKRRAADDADEAY